MFSAVVLLDLIYSIQVNEIPMVVCNSLILLFSIIHQFVKFKINKCEYLLIIVLFFHNAVQIYYYGRKSLWFLIYLLQIFKLEQHTQILKYCKFTQLAVNIIIYSIQYDGQINFAYFQQLNYCIFILIYQIYNQNEQVSEIDIAQNQIIEDIKQLIIFKLFDQKCNDLSKNASNFNYNQLQTTPNQNNDNQNFQIKAYQDKEFDSPAQNQCGWEPSIVFNDYQTFIEHIKSQDNQDSQYHYVAIQTDFIKNIKTKYNVLYKKFGKNELITIALIRIDSFHQRLMIWKFNKFKKYFYDIFAHKLKTPLNASLGFLSSAYNYTEMDNAIKQNYIKPAYINSKLQYFQISDLLEFLNPQSDQTRIQYYKINMKSFLFTLNELIESQCQNKKILFQVFVENVPLNNIDKFYILSDLLKLERILYNLLNLTYRYTPQNGQITLNLCIDKKNSEVLFIINSNEFLFNNEELENINECIRCQVEFQYKKKSIALKKEIKLSLEITNHLINILNDQEYHLEISQSDGGTEFKFKLIIKENKLTEGSLEQFTIGFMLKQKSTKTVNYGTNEQSCNSSNLIKPKSLSLFSSSKVVHEPQANTPITTPINQPKTFKTPALKRLRSSFADRVLIDFDQKILIVDDEPFNHDILILMMKTMGYTQFLKAYNGQQAIDIVKEKKGQISIIIMDLDMPIMGGIEATRILVEMMLDQKLDYIPIIGCTAHDDKETIDKCLQIGMLYVVVKPVFVKTLREAFQQITNMGDGRRRSLLCFTSQLQI
ncbi:unnamed protein product (macronuclear) [Paramecium tetraurelia]|uniref:Response regulatory domain-containing protein n=1 Tax=Paramecium tetraurelia TaxID=5888 RepID=A0BF25_PARTE|nr:uncharacterized protein GSPATT00028177001 [Paramecium tetraurelia]CAK57142.1 unnamed protein product [Paramecium tetraurelia]|eukprot:XP_001424540.1 hypothetical protein (macronuclear) [Paramecium tetraurelia strain d4-2]